jgi:uncharacterized protein YndB with AHSA1/START domain
MPVRSEIHVDASPEEVWKALVDEQRRADWLDEPEREIDVEEVRAPDRLVWWWVDDDGRRTRVEVLIVAAPVGARVVVTESIPAFPLASLAASLARVPA